MDESEKIQIIDEFLRKLNSEQMGRGTIPGLLNGHPNNRVDKSLKMKYRVIENELERLELVHFLRGKDNSTIDGFAEYRIAPKGIELLLNNQSSKILFEPEKKAKDSESVQVINAENVIYNTNSTIGKQTQKTEKEGKSKTSILQIVAWIIGIAAGALAIYQFFIK